MVYRAGVCISRGASTGSAPVASLKRDRPGAQHRPGVRIHGVCPRGLIEASIPSGCCACRCRIHGVCPRGLIEARPCCSRRASRRVGGCSASTTFAARVASYEDVTRHPQNDRTRCLGRIASRRHPTAGNRPREVTRSGSMPRHAACSDPEPDSPPRLVNHRGTAGTPRSKGGPQGPELLAEPRGGQRVTWWMRRPLPSAASRYLTIPPTAPVHPLRRRAGGPVFGVFSGSVT